MNIVMCGSNIVHVLFLVYFNFLLQTVNCELRSSFFGSQVPEYSYDLESRNGPYYWGRVHGSCDGHQQSPIILDERNSIGTPHPLILKNFNLLPREIEMENDGQTVEMTFHYANNENATITSSLLKNDIFIVHSVHFHWGENDEEGSEHTIGWQRFSGEIHIVSYNSKFRSLEEARNKNRGVVVLASFLTVDDKQAPNDLTVMYYTRNYMPNKTISSNSYLSQLPKLIVANSKVTLRNQNVVSLYDVIKGSVVSYYTYKGSFTTPNCEETVTWLINRLPVRIRSRDLQNFRRLRDTNGDRISRNFRPLQDRHNRKLFKFYNVS